jgi:hypothetical protein
MISQTYVYPRFSKPDFGLLRLGNRGLGNLLFPWARAVILGHRYRLKLISPTWRTVTAGPILRAERDKRWYWDLFLSRSNYVRGFEKLKVLSTWPRITEKEFVDRSMNDLMERQVVICEGMGNLFRPLLPYAEVVKDELRQITPERYKPRFVENLRRTVVVHVRRGDFRPATMDQIERGEGNSQVPMKWYLSVVEKLRFALNETVSTLIVSDGSDSELSEILSLGPSQRLHPGAAIQDLLVLASAGVLIASGSTFSMWGSFVGRMPVIWPRGQLLQNLYGDQRELEIEMGLSDELPPAFVAAARQRLTG